MSGLWTVVLMTTWPLTFPTLILLQSLLKLPKSTSQKVKQLLSLMLETLLFLMALFSTMSCVLPTSNIMSCQLRNWSKNPYVKFNSSPYLVTSLTHPLKRSLLQVLPDRGVHCRISDSKFWIAKKVKSGIFEYLENPDGIKSDIGSQYLNIRKTDPISNSYFFRSAQPTNAHIYLKKKKKAKMCEVGYCQYDPVWILKLVKLFHCSTWF